MITLHKITLISALVFAMSGAALADDDFDDCVNKKAELEYKVAKFKAQNRQGRATEAQYRLDQVNQYCTPEYQQLEAKHMVAKYERKVSEQQREVAEEEAALSRAEAANDTKRILKYRNEVAEEKAELTEKQAKLQLAKERLAKLGG